MLQIRLHGRGGQGGKTSAEIIASSVIRSGKEAKTFPDYGPERSGAPVRYYIKISDREIKSNQPIAEPDAVVVLDETLLGKSDIIQGLRKGGFFVLNSSPTPSKLNEVKNKIGNNFKIAIVNASQIAIDLFRKNFPNVPIVGAIARVTGEIEMEGLINETKKKFRSLPREIIEKNIQALKEGYNTVKLFYEKEKQVK
ncbi:MAG: 2-oxoacid:acceptor oxidoreductase family protein [Patescibacteria group bacterium]